jgi:hypothetical protein
MPAAATPTSDAPAGFNGRHFPRVPELFGLDFNET